MSQYLVNSMLEINVLFDNIKETIDSAKDKHSKMTTPRVVTLPGPSSSSAPTPAPDPHVRGRSFDMPPEYSATESCELVPRTPASSAEHPLPAYTAVCEDSPSGFSPTKSFQIQAPGLPVIRLPLAPRPDPIHVFCVSDDGQLQQPEYVSIRPSRDSGSCFLARADDVAKTILCATTYRFGPGRPAKMRIPGDEASGDHEFELNSKGYVSRTIVMRTHLGTFEWRYATRSERKAARSASDQDIDCLLLFDHITSIALTGGRQEEKRVRVGQFIRSASLRTPGSKRSSAGNGGRLMLDLRAWADTKGDGEQVEILAVASCVSMLKKEGDRRRAHQMMGAGGGGC